MPKTDQMLYKFIWQNKFSDKKAFEKVKRSVLNASEVRGRLNMISEQDMKYALEISWIKRLIQRQGARWTAILSYEYQKFGGVTNVFESSVDVKSFQFFDKICNRFGRILFILDLIKIQLKGHIFKIFLHSLWKMRACGIMSTFVIKGDHYSFLNGRRLASTKWVICLMKQAPCYHLTKWWEWWVTVLTSGSIIMPFAIHYPQTGGRKMGLSNCRPNPNSGTKISHSCPVARLGSLLLVSITENPVVQPSGKRSIALFFLMNFG